MKIRLPLIAFLSFAIFQSCKFQDREPQDFSCEWNIEKTIPFNDLQLRIPSYGMSNYFNNQFPESQTDGIIRQLTTVMDTRGDYMTSKPSNASLKTTLKLEGTGCIGEKTVTYYQGSPKISGNTVTIPFVSNDVFAGEVTIILRSDVFQDYANGSSYQVIWRMTGNDPDNVNGNVYGSKTGFAGDTQSIILPDDEPVIIEGNEIL